MMNKVIINKKKKSYTREELEQLDKNELIDKILQLDAAHTNLKNVLQKKLNGQEILGVFGGGGCNDASSATNAEGTKSNRKRKFDFSKTYKRHVLLKFLYFGWDYQGYAAQEDSNNTIEYHLFTALTRTCLIESRASSNYQRCGRTDKGVSGFSQVISIDLRSKFPEAEQLQPHAIANEIDYCEILNKVLPNEIQCICWSPCPASDYSARFDCLTRTYRYYFPKGDLNIEAMQAACQLLQRHADFRNFCKMDVQNGVTQFRRRIDKAIIRKCFPNVAVESNNNEDYGMFFLEITANAFLLHQIRCIMTVLLLIGQGREEINIIDEFFNIEKNACKPQYQPALALPLNLFHAEFKKRDTQREAACAKPENASSESDSIKSHVQNKLLEDCEKVEDWNYSRMALVKLIENLQSQWTQHNIKATMLRDVLDHLTILLNGNFTDPISVQTQAHALHATKVVSLQNYQKLLTRKRCESLENRIAHYVKKQKLIVAVNHDDDDDVDVDNDDEGSNKS